MPEKIKIEVTEEVIDAGIEALSCFKQKMVPSMYVEMKSENWNDIQSVIAKAKDLTGPVQITLRKSDNLYCLVAVCKTEPD
ncbi:MAG TPA: hypothetical protein VGG48_02975 [Rhizomicrobium sp.]|jgi:hypothetical protein